MKFFLTLLANPEPVVGHHLVKDPFTPRATDLANRHRNHATCTTLACAGSRPIVPAAMGARVDGVDGDPHADAGKHSFDVGVRHAATRLLAPLLIALIPLFWTIDATRRASLMALGRDQGIFQYIAWAVLRGDVDYRDVRDVNGPLTHMIHAVFLLLGGHDEHRFRVLDLAVTGASFALAGSCMPGLVATRVTRLERGAWALAGGVVLMAQYNMYLAWNQAQRESFCDWFLLPSLAMQAMALPITPRAAQRRIATIAALSAVTWFGKTPFVLYTALQFAVLMLDQKAPLGRRERAASFAVGCAVAMVVPVAYLLARGDVPLFARITLVDVPQVYSFIWAKSPQEILGAEGPLTSIATGFATSALLTALIVVGELPIRVLALALAPVAATACIVLQGKGFGYHFHPLTASTHLGLLAITVMLWERFRDQRPAGDLGKLLALGTAVALGLWVTTNMCASPIEQNVWILEGGETAERRASSEYLDTFKTHDFFPTEMRACATYLAQTVSEHSTVQTYGMDPYVLFLARRKSATPYIYAYDLNASAALEGGWSHRPTAAQASTIMNGRDAHEEDLLHRLKHAPPEAFVFIDASPLLAYQDAWEDFQHCCARTAAWVAGEYTLAQSFGPFHVWRRAGSSGVRGALP